MKKVLFVATVTGHINAFHLPCLKLFKDNGYEVHVATGDDIEVELYCDKKFNIGIKRRPASIRNIKAISYLKKIIATEKYDIIHCHTPIGGVVTRLAARTARKKYGTRVIYTAHGFHFYKGSSLKNWLLFYPVEKYLSKFTDTLITINKEDYELAIKKFSKRCKDIQYVPGVGIDASKYDFIVTKKERIKLRKSLGLKESDVVLIFPARLDRDKNQIFLINCMEQLIKKHDNIHLLLPGKDELNGFYQKVVEEKKMENFVHFLGHRDDIPQLLKISNIAVSSSKREGLGVNVLEAIVCKLPVVCYLNRGHKDIITSDNGFLFEEEEDFIRNVNSIIKNKFKANEHSIDKFMLDNVIEKMKKIYVLK